MPDPNPTTTRTYMFPVRIAVGTREPLTEAQRRKLAKEISATLAIHLDIPGTLRPNGNPVNGDSYIVMPVAPGREVK